MVVIVCDVCGGEYDQSHGRNFHVRTRRHRRAEYIVEDERRHPIQGRILKSTLGEHVVYDVYFPTIDALCEQIRAFNGDDQIGSGMPGTLTSPEEDEPIVTVADFIRIYRDGILARFESAFEQHNALKVQLIVYVQLKRFRAETDDYEYITVALETNSSKVFPQTNVEEWLLNATDYIQGKLNTLEHIVHSGWSLSRFEDMELKFSRYNPLSSGTWIKAPKSINYKKSNKFCVN
jgi:hypothetical protein